MATDKQEQAAKENIKKAQQAWQEMSSKERSRRQPEGSERNKPGTTGEGDYYHVEVRPKSEFVTFRTDDVSHGKGALRVAGQRSSGSWDTQKWLIPKEKAYIDEAGYLKGKDESTKDLLDKLGAVPRREKGDIFKAKPRENIPESKKPTKAQEKARKENIKKAQEARTNK
jgi:hypothetical protein